MLIGIPTIGQLKNTEIPREKESYYVFPVQPGQSGYLSGTMGELRSGHFHGGLDIKTGGKVGLKVHATANGYISRIKISEGGYGNALYMAHPNGTTSVYGHLKEFSGAIAKYVRSAQYEKERFAIELFPDKGALKFSKGEVIGFSGNSGSSGGPHLHFEIRDGAQKPINPLKFGFSEIRDNIAPTIYKMALVTMDQDSRVNHQFGRFEFDVIKKGSYYTTDLPIKAYGRIGIELLAYDKLNGANNRNGVPCIELQVDGKKLFNQNISTFAFSETRDILVHTNYEVHRTTGKRFNKLYVDEGNKLKFYETNEDKGVLQVGQASSHEVNINLWDMYNNASVLNFKIEGTPPIKDIQGSSGFADNNEYLILENTLVIYGNKATPECKSARIFSQRMNYELTSSYSVNDTPVYLWDMDQGLPDSAQLCQETVSFPYVANIPGGKSFSFYHDRINLDVPTNALYDTVFLKLDYGYNKSVGSEVFQVLEDIAPMRKNISISLKPQKSYDHKKTLVYSLNSKNKPSYEGGEWAGNLIKFRTRSFGRFTLLTDSLAPKIKPVNVSDESLRFTIEDELSGISSYRATVDGKWVLMNYDYKRKLLWSEKLDNTKPFKGPVELKIVDRTGNINYYRTTI